MPEPVAEPRPPQVTYAAWAVILGSLAMVVSAFQRIATLHSLDTRATIEKMVADQPSAVHLTVTDWLEVFKVLGMVSAAGAVAAAILGWQLMQRSRSARVALLVLVAPLTIAGLATNPLFALLIAFGVISSWFPAANAWFDPHRHAKMPVVSEAPAPPPGPSDPSGPSEPSGPAGPSGQQPPPSYGPYGQPSGHAPQYGYPASPYAQQPYGAPQHRYVPPTPYGLSPFDPDARPRTVTAAAIITFVLAGLGTLLGLVVAVVGALTADDLLRELAKEGHDTGSLTSSQLAAGFVGVGAVATVCGVAAIVAAIFVLRRSRGARIVLTVLAGITIALSLVGIASVVSLLTLAGAIATIVLLFRSSSNAWFARRPQQPPFPPNYPPTAPPTSPGAPRSGA